MCRLSRCTDDLVLVSRREDHHAVGELDLIWHEHVGRELGLAVPLLHYSAGSKLALGGDPAHDALADPEPERRALLRAVDHARRRADRHANRVVVLRRERCGRVVRSAGGGGGPSQVFFNFTDHWWSVDSHSSHSQHIVTAHSHSTQHTTQSHCLASPHCQKQQQNKRIPRTSQHPQESTRTQRSGVCNRARQTGARQTGGGGKVPRRLHGTALPGICTYRVDDPARDSLLRSCRRGLVEISDCKHQPEPNKHGRHHYT